MIFEKSGLLFFSSKCVMLGRVNIVGHVPILNKYTINECTVRDSFSFCNEIRKQDSSFYMASFDVQSLFTNISLDETIDICVYKVFQHKKIS